MNEMYLYRLDTACNYILHDEKAVLAYCEYLKRLEYPRRSEVRRDYFGGLYWSGRNSTLKIYAKGAEFKYHDFDRLSRSDDVSDLAALCALSACILRVELEHKMLIRARVNEYKKSFPDEVVLCLSGYPKLKDFFRIYDARLEFEKHKSRLLNGTQGVVVNSEMVEKTLIENYGARQASSFIRVYYSWTVHGKVKARSMCSQNMFARASRAFRECGIDVLASDVVKVPNFHLGFPEDFKAFNLSLTGNSYLQELRKAA
jgi:hypothetical protein